MRSRFAQLLETSETTPSTDRILSTTFWQPSESRTGGAVIDLEERRARRTRLP